jgi:hypothetical protein
VATCWKLCELNFKTLYGFLCYEESRTCLHTRDNVHCYTLPICRLLDYETMLSWMLVTRLHGTTAQKIKILLSSAVKTLNIIYLFLINLIIVNQFLSFIPVWKPVIFLLLAYRFDSFHKSVIFYLYIHTSITFYYALHNSLYYLCSLAN